MCAARLKEIGVVRNTRVADRFCGTTIGEEDANAWVHAGTASDDRASASCAGKPNEISCQCRSGGDEENAGKECDLELHFDCWVASRVTKKTE